MDLLSKNDDIKNISGIELLNASKLFGIPKLVLKNIVSGKLEIIVSKELIRVQIQIKSEIRNTDKITSLSVERVRPEFAAPAELHLLIAQISSNNLSF